MRYELTEETMQIDGCILHRVKYLENGELGGLVESEKNLSQDGNAQVSGDAYISGNAQVSGDACVSGDARVFGNACVSNNAYVSDHARVSGDARVSGNAHISGFAHISGDARVFCGVWDVSPLQIQGSKYFFSVSSKDSITVGDHTKTFIEWLETYEQNLMNIN